MQQEFKDQNSELTQSINSLSTNVTAMVIPDYSKGISVGTSFTATSNGIYTATVGYNNGGSYFNINGVDAFYYADGDGVNGMVNTPFTIPLAKGDVCYWSPNVSVKFAKFYPLKGAV